MLEVSKRLSNPACVASARRPTKKRGGGLISWATAPAAALALGLFLTPPTSGTLGIVSPAHAQPGALTKAQSDARDAYENALSGFKAVLAQRRAQISAKEP